jgi:uncharacterized heparinase superfamily protein
VRARALSVATRLGAVGLDAELTRACRAILAQPELHLLANHLLENGFGLACGGAAAIGPEADLWWNVGQAILDWQLPQQFLADGGHFERTATYHMWLAAALLETLELGRASGRPMSPLWSEIARRAVQWATCVRAPDGTYPLFNDASLDAAPSIEAVIELAGGCGIRSDGSAEPAPSDHGTVHLPQTGWVLCRVEDAAWLAIDAGPVGASYQPGHVHADALTFELWVNGQRTCVDYGVSSYGRDGARETSRATRSHNTVEVNESDSCEVWGAFRVGRRCDALTRRVRCAGSRIEVDTAHSGYAHLSGSPVHCRLFVLSPRTLRIRDRIQGVPTTAISRIRTDEEAHPMIRLSGAPGGVAVSAGVWFPRLGVPRGAVVAEVDLAASPDFAGFWTIEW